MVEGAAKVKPPVLTTAILQAGLCLQMLCDAWRAVAPFAFMPESYNNALPVTLYQGALVLAAVNVIGLLTWLVLAMRFIAPRATPALTFTPAWAVVWWLIPIANFVTPFLTMLELHNASRNPGNWSRRHWPLFAILWWGATLAGLVIAALSRFGDALGIDVPPDLDLGSVAHAVAAFRLLCLLALVTVIIRFQKALDGSGTKPETIF